MPTQYSSSHIVMLLFPYRTNGLDLFDDLAVTESEGHHLRLQRLRWRISLPSQVIGTGECCSWLRWSEFLDSGTYP